MTMAILGLSGCSDRPSRPNPRAERMDATTARPTMSAQDSFFEGKLLVEANLGQGFSGRGAGPGGERGMGGGRPSVGGGKRGGGMPGGPGGGGPGGGGPGGGDMGGMQESGGGFGGGSSIHESNMPPIALRLRLTNQGKETVEVVFTLCKSVLGDFAVRPEKLALAPEQSAEPDPMTSRLGLSSGELHLTVGLRMGGKVEQKELILKASPGSKPTASAKP